MKVGVGVLKANLSAWLKRVERESQVVEVCVREETVAYLVPASHPPGTAAQDESEIRTALERQGLSVRRVAANLDAGWIPTPVAAPDGDTGQSTVERIRKERPW